MAKNTVKKSESQSQSQGLRVVKAPKTKPYNDID